ncbi:unnamed protein product, partial [Amoebophrya sp. A25]|eukprot:GSA25T00003081001.1
MVQRKASLARGHKTQVDALKASCDDWLQNAEALLKKRKVALQREEEGLESKILEVDHKEELFRSGEARSVLETEQRTEAASLEELCTNFKGLTKKKNDLDVAIRATKGRVDSLREEYSSLRERITD